MRKTKKKIENKAELTADDFLTKLNDDGWTYIKTVVDIVREPVLILDQDMRVLAANDPFCRTFQIKRDNAENKTIYELGNGEWDIPGLRKLLESILPQNTFFRGFEVDYDFPVVGHKVLILNGREVHCKEDSALKPCPRIILLAIEDVTDMMDVADMLSRYANYSLR